MFQIIDSIKRDGASNKQDLAATLLFQSIKNYEGQYKNRSKIYYDEREWRYIPDLDGSAFPPYIDIENCDQLVSFGKKPHIIDNAYLLSFTEKDIDYIFVDNRILKNELCERFGQNIEITKRIKVRKSFMF